MTRITTGTDVDKPADDTRSFRDAPVVLDVSTDVDSTGAADGTPPSGLAADLRHERFRIGGKLGEGGMGVVFRARDTRENRDVALKLMKGSLTGTARRRFEREFRSLSTLRHPHCLGVYDYGELAGGPFFTMELFLGQPITGLSSRPLAERFEPLLQLTHALDYIHGHGIIHRDVKPSNVLVRPATRADGSWGFETRLMDFGLARYYGVKSSLSAEAGFVGTVAYCAPEQINLDELDHRADLYCLGLVAYEVLTGRYPFPDARLAGVRPLMQAQLNDRPRPVAEVNPEVPPAIADAVMQYLRKRPRRRPDSAALLREALAGALGIDAASLVTGVSLPQMRPGLSVTGFVCRAREQELLEDVLRRGLRPSRAEGESPIPLIVVSGEPGIGKSSVVQEAERLARGHGCQVYEGRCFDGNLSPFQPFVEILRQLVAELKLQERREIVDQDVDLTGTHIAGLPAASHVRLLAIMDEYRGEILRVAPELRKYLPGEAYRQVDYGREADHIYRALASMLLEIAAVQPICLSFEDLQWADTSSLDLLRHLASAHAASRPDNDAGPPRLLIVASARTGYASLDAMVEQLRERRLVLELRLAPLNEAETRELIALRLNCQADEVSGDLVSRVHSLCAGNPFFIAETVREWHEKEAIARTDGGNWTLQTEVGDSTDLPETVRDVMRLRIQGLPPQAQQVLGAAAVIGAVVDIDLLRDVLPELSEADVLDAVDVLLPRRVFRETDNPGHVEFVHDLLHELPYADLSATRRRSLHRRIASLLESRREKGRAVAPSVLAEHFEHGDEPAKAFAYTMEAAQAAVDAYAFNNAIALLKDAQRLLPETADAPTRYRLWSLLGQALGAAGQVDEAIEAYRRSVEFAGDRFERAVALLGIGSAYHRKGDYDTTLREFRRSLAELGYSYPSSPVGYLIGIWRSAAFFHLMPTRLATIGRGPELDRGVRIAFAVYMRICQLPVNILRYTCSSYRLAALAKRSGIPELLAGGNWKIYFSWALFSLERPMIVYRRRALECSAGCEPEVKALCMAHVSGAQFFSGHPAEAEASLRESAALLDRVGDWFGWFTHHMLRHLYAVLGDLPRELAEAEFEIATGLARGDAEALAYGQYGKAAVLAKLGRHAEAIELVSPTVESLKRRNSMALLIAYAHLGFVRLMASEYQGARLALEQSRRCILRTGYLFEFAAPTFPLLVESLLGPDWSKPEVGPGRAAARKARREAWGARFVAWRFPSYRPHALRVSGRAAFALGRSKAAARYLERAIESARSIGARYELARSYLDASLVIPEKSDEYRRLGRDLLREIGAVIPQAEAERLGLNN